MTNPPQLDYGRRRSLIDRIGPRRFIVYATLVAGVLAVALAYDPIVGWVQKWRVQRQAIARQRSCMTYTAPADRVVYDEDPDRAAALLARDPMYYPIVAFNIATGQPILALARPPVLYEEPIWGRYNQIPAGTKRNVVFLHERAAKSGVGQMVAVEMTSQFHCMADGSWGIVRFLTCWPADADTFEISSDAPRPAEIGTDPVTADPAGRFPPPFPLRLYAGQPDPNDASRFTIAYELQGYRGVIVGVLGDDSRVVLTPDIGRLERPKYARQYVVWRPQIPQRSAAAHPSTVP